MTPEIEALPFDELRALHREIGALLARKRHQALEELKEKASLLGFTTADFIPEKTARAKPKYRNPDDPTQTYGGKGKRPAWLQDKLDAGHDISEFAI